MGTLYSAKIPNGNMACKSAGGRKMVFAFMELLRFILDFSA